MTSRRLDNRELDCLQRIATDPAGRAAACPWYVLETLLALGLIERNARVMLPLPLLRHSFRLTHAGQALLQDSKQRPGN